MVTAVERHVSIDRRRVYVVGLSNGEMMALKAICEAPDVFAAGSVAGPYLGSIRKRPVWVHLHDARDPIVPYYGGHPPGSAFLHVASDWCLCSFPNSATEARRFSLRTVSVKLVVNGVHSWPRVADGAWNFDGNANLWRESRAFTSDRSLSQLTPAADSASSTSLFHCRFAARQASSSAP